MNYGDAFPIVVTAICLLLTFGALWLERRRQERVIDERSQLLAENKVLLGGSLRLVVQLELAGLVPVWRPPLNGDALDIDGDRLVYALQHFYTKDELETLAHDAGCTEYDGSGALPVVALRLATAARNRGREQQLIDAVRRSRPNAHL